MLKACSAWHAHQGCNRQGFFFCADCQQKLGLHTLRAQGVRISA